jgi:hypothetical protein
MVVVVVVVVVVVALLTTWIKVLHQTLLVSQLIKKFPTFIGLEFP